MKNCINNLLFLSRLIAALGLITAIPLTAQTFTTLYSFSPSSTNSSGAYTNSDGANPYAGLTVAGNGNTRYGTASLGGSSGAGTVFAVNTDGTGFTILHSFNYSDGADPWAGLILSSNTLYGTTYHGGSSSNGTVFAINTNGTGFTNLHHFTDALEINGIDINADGAYPNAGLILSGNTLYGTASQGGSSGSGTVFKVNTDGTGFSNLHSFTYSDGADPVAGLILYGSTLYGTATGGGAGRNGTIFAINPDGSGFKILHSFQPSQQIAPPYCDSSFDCPPGFQCSGGHTCACTGFCGGLRSVDWATAQRAVNFEGANPNAGLVLSGGILYGTAAACGSSGYGTVFAVNTNGAGFTVLHSFTGGSDGANPWAGLITNLSGNTLCGTTYNGGSSGKGTVFTVNTDGTGFISLHGFTGGSDGAGPIGGLILTNNTLYGTTDLGGSSGKGAVFSLFIQPQLKIISSGANLILTWPTNYTEFHLQSTTNLGSSAVWTIVSPPSVVIGGQYTVTNLISAPQQFYRLSTHTGGCHINLDCPPGTTCVNGICVCFGGRGCGDGG